MTALAVIVFVLVLAGYAALETVGGREGPRSWPGTAPPDFDLEGTLEGWSETAGELASGRAERVSSTEGDQRDEPEL